MYLKGTDKKKIHKEAKHNHNTWYRVVYAQFLSRSISSRKNRSVSIFSSVAFLLFTRRNSVFFARKVSSKITQEEGEICVLESPQAKFKRISPIIHWSRSFVIIEIKGSYFQTINNIRRCPQCSPRLLCIILTWEDVFLKAVFTKRFSVIREVFWETEKPIPLKKWTHKPFPVSVLLPKIKSGSILSLKVSYQQWSSLKVQDLRLSIQLSTCSLDIVTSLEGNVCQILFCFFALVHVYIYTCKFRIKGSGKALANGSSWLVETSQSDCCIFEHPVAKLIFYCLLAGTKCWMKKIIYLFLTLLF